MPAGHNVELVHCEVALIRTVDDYEHNGDDEEATEQRNLNTASPI